MRNKNINNKREIGGFRDSAFSFIFYLMIFAVLMIPPIDAQSFIVHNQSNESQNYFTVNGSTGDTEVLEDLQVDGDVTTDGNVTASWFRGAFNWIVGVPSQIYLTFNGTQLDFDEGQLNTTIDSRISEGQGDLHVNMSDWWNTGDRGTLRNISQIQGSWITNDLAWINFTDGDGRYVLLTEESNLNVNRSEWWRTAEGDLNNVEDILGSWLTNDLAWINFTEGDGRYLLITDESNLNVNSSDFWRTNEGIKENVEDILGSEITNNLAWINFTQADPRYVNVDGDTMTGDLVIDADLTVGTNLLFANSSGSLVGIGTVTPQNKLNVVGDINATETVYAGEFSGAINWTFLQNYPNGCPAGQAVQVIGDTLTCIDINPVNVTNGTGTVDQIPRWITETTLGNSIIKQSGTTIVVEGDLNVTDFVAAGDVIVLGRVNISQDLQVDGDVTTDGNVTASWFRGAFNWIVGVPSQIYLTFNGTQLDFDEGQLNTTIDSRISEGQGDLHVNMSDYWNTADRGALRNVSQILGSWITNDLSWINFTQADPRYVEITGDTMTGNLDINANLTVGTSVLFVDSNGNVVGIGTATPQNTLNVVGDANITDNLYGGIIFEDGVSLIDKYVQLTRTLEFSGTSNQISVTPTGPQDLSDNRTWTFSLPQDINTTSSPEFVGLNVTGNASVGNRLDIGGEWSDGGVSIVDGEVFAQTLFVYNITSLNVNTLNINGSLLPAEGFSETFDIGADSRRWRDLFVSRNADVGGNLNVDGDANITGTLYYGTLDGEANLNVNSSDFWDGLDTPADINAGDLTDDNTYLEVAGDTGTGNFVFNQNLTVDTNTLFVDSSSNKVGIGTASPAYNLDVAGTGRFSGDVRLDAGKNLKFYDHDATFPTATGGFIWDLNNDNAKIYAQQPASDQIDFVFKIADNVGTTDRFVYWIDSYTGETDDAYPLYMDGTKAVFNYPTVFGTGASKNIDFYLMGFNKSSLSDTYFFGDASTGNVGIGTTAPQTKLHVAGNAIFNGTINTDSNKIINIANGTSSQDAVALSQLQTVNTSANFPRGDIVQGTGLSLSGTLTERLVDSGSVTFNLANTAVTPGTYGGNIQVGTFTVDQQGRLTSASNVTIRDASASVSGVVSTGTQTFAGAKTFNNNLVAGQNLTVDTNTLFVDSSSNKVGIGTASPNTLLTVGTTGSNTDFGAIASFYSSSSNNNTVKILAPANQAGSGPHLHLMENNPNLYGYDLWYDTGADTLELDRYQNSVKTHVLTVQPDGDVGIGTTTPQNPLNVIGDINATGTVYSGGSAVLTSFTESDPIWSANYSSRTGTGNVVYSNSPTITSPTISTSINLPSGAVDAAGEISDDIITNAHFTHSTDWGDVSTDASGNVQIDSGVVSDAEVSSLSWSKLNNYPTACNSDETITVIGDTITCTSISITGSQVSDDGTYLLATGDTATGNYTFDTNTLFIDSSSNKVGIGTTSPGAKLDVADGGSTDYGITSTPSAIFGQSSGATRGYLKIFGKTAGSYGVVQMTTGNLHIDSSTAGKLYLNHYAGTDTTINPNGGNVGIGEAAPGSKLSVSGGGSFGAGYDTTAAPTNGLIIQGNVGIGTTSPQNTLNVDGDANITGTLYYGTLDGEANLNVNSSDFWDGLDTPADINAGDLTDDNTYLLATGDTATGNYTFDTNTLFIDSSSNKVGIGTTSPVTNAKLDVTGRIVGGLGHVGESALTTSASEHWLSARSLITLGESAAGNANPAITMYRTSSGFVTGTATRIFQPSSAGDLYFQKGTTNVAYGSETYTTNMVILAGGNVGIGTTTPQNPLNVIGDGNFTGNVYRNNQLLIDWAQATNGTLALSARTLTAGSGLTGGGDLTADRTFNVGAGTAITVNANDVAVTNDAITDTQLAFNTGQHLTTSSGVQFGTLSVDTSATSLNGTNTNAYINKDANEYGLIINYGFDSPDEPAGLLLTGDADGTDDIAIEVRGNTLGSTVHNPTWGTGVSSTDSKFVVFGDGTTVIGKGSVGDAYSTTQGSKLEVSGKIYTSDDIDIGGGDLLTAGSNFFNGGCSADQYVSSISSDGTINCASDSATGTMSSFTLGATSGTNQTISEGDTAFLNAGTGITTTASATDIVTIAATLGTAIEKGELANSGTLSFDWVDSEVADALTISGGTIALSTNIYTGTLGGDNITDGTIDATELAANAVTAAGGELDSSVAGNQLTYNSGALDVQEGAGSGLDADTLDTIDSTGFCQSDGTNCPAGASDQNLFATINAPSGTDPVADSATDILNLAASGIISITGDSSTDTITIDATEVGDISAVTAGSGLTGGGTSGAVTLDVGAGTGISVAADSISATLGTSIVTGEIVDGTILELDLNVTNTPTDNYVLSYDSGTGGFTWIQDDTGTDTTYTAGGTLLDLTGTTFSVNEGTLTSGKGCKFVTGTGIVCDQDYLTSFTETDPKWSANYTACGAGNHLYFNGASLACEADDDTTYTAGDALTLTGTDFDFDGGASPGGELGGTWASPTVDSGIHDDEYLEVAGDTGTGNFIFNQNLTVDTNTLFVNSNTNNVGIGTTGPDEPLQVGTFTTRGAVRIMQVDDGTSDHIQFYNDGTRMGEIGSQDETWLRINQETAKNIYTPRYIRADGGFFVDGAVYGIDGSGILQSNTGATIGGNTAWHQGNDGSGSTLDADTLDTIDSTGFCQSDGTNCPTDDDTTYTAGDALTLTGTDFDFDGGATPGGDLGGTWASPSVDDDSHNHVYSNIDATTSANWATRVSDETGSGNWVFSASPTFTGTVTAPLLNVNTLGNVNGNYLVINVGESASYATGQTGEILYVNAEGGLQVASSPDNWVSGWAGRTTATINAAGGDSSFPGNVGIGTTSPTGKLTIFDISTDNAAFEFTESSTSGYTTTFNMDNTGLDIGHDSTSRALNLITGGSDRLTILGGGNVGIGTASPSGKLHVYTGNSGASIINPGADELVLESSGNHGLTLIGPNTSTAQIVFGDEDDYDVGRFIYSHSEDYLSTIVAGVERMRITNAGNVGIGETAPGSKLSVSGGGSFGAGYDTTAAPTNGLIVEGNVGIGTTGPQGELHVKTGTDENLLVRTVNGALETASVNDANNAYQPWRFDASEFDFQNGNVIANAGVTVDGILLDDAADRSGLLEINRKGSTVWTGIQSVFSGTAEWSLMGDEDNLGLYDDTNGNWILLYTENAGSTLYYNGGSRITTTSGGASIAGSIDMNSNDITEVDKITVNTVDPPYTINNKAYATYMAGMIGLKEEVTGSVKLGTYSESEEGYKHVIDFNNMEEGSDLWLFGETINIHGKTYIDPKTGKERQTDTGEVFDNMVVLLSSGFNGNVWYEKIPEEKKLVIYGSKPSEVSYRFTGTRFDGLGIDNTRTAEIDKNGLELDVPEGLNLDKLLKSMRK